MTAFFHIEHIWISRFVKGKMFKGTSDLAHSIFSWHEETKFEFIDPWLLCNKFTGGELAEGQPLERQPWKDWTELRELVIKEQDFPDLQPIAFVMNKVLSILFCLTKSEQEFHGHTVCSLFFKQIEGSKSRPNVLHWFINRIFQKKKLYFFIMWSLPTNFSVY